MELKGKNLWLRRLAFAVIIVLTASLQNSKGLVFAPFGVHAVVLVPLIVSISFFEKSVISLLFGAFAGILWDMGSSVTDGYFSIVLAVIAFSCSLLIAFEMRNNIRTALLLSAGACFLCNLFYWLFFILFKRTDMAVYIYFKYYFTSSVYTVVYTFVFYYLVRWISQRTEPEKKRINY